jgi:hypothetical protein
MTEKREGDVLAAAAKTELRAAWDEMMVDLGKARDAIDQPELMPVPPSDRNLADGYRYLLGFVHSAIERAMFDSVEAPAVRKVISLINKGTIDNADAIYFAAAIDGRFSYLLRGNVGDSRHWRGEDPVSSGLKAPQYLIFELSDGCLAGDSGTLMELRPGVKIQTGKLDSTSLQVNENGEFEVLLAPAKPEGFSGNFIPTMRRSSRPNPDDPDAGPERYATYLSGRQLFYDWEHEEPAQLTLTRVDEPKSLTPDFNAATAAAQLRRLGAMARGQMHFWNQFNTVLLETYGKAEGKEGEPFMPRNKFNKPNAAARETGGGQSTNLYAGGVYELADDEALIVESRVQVAPQYIGFHVANLWGESHDFGNHQSSLNGFQAQADDDGVLRWVIAHEDPGVANWIDTTGHPEGYMALRWAYSDKPAEDLWPQAAAKKVPVADIAAYLPATTARVSPKERARQIAIRREHVQKR